MKLDNPLHAFRNFQPSGEWKPMMNWSCEYAKAPQDATLSSVGIVFWCFSTKRSDQGADTTGLKSAINADANLAGLGLSATSASTVVSMSVGVPTYTASTSAGATETITLGTNINGNITAAIGGTKTAGDTLTVTTRDAENRLIQVTYPGSGNNSQFTYDGLGRNVKIVETAYAKKWISESVEIVVSTPD